MTEVILEELLDSDIAWMVQKGERRQLSAHQVLIRQGQPLKTIYILLTGSLIATVADDPSLEQTLIHFSTGEIVGEMGCLRSFNSTVVLQSDSESTILEVPYTVLQNRLQQDPAFAARFYRTIAILLLKRFEQVIDRFSRRRGLQVSLMQDAPVLLGELHDSDVDWMVEQGTVQEANPEQVLIQAGRAVETLYVVLVGELSIGVVENKRSDLNEIFSQLRETPESSGRQIARLGKGEMAGETALLGSRLSNVMVKAKERSVLLALPRSQLALKLQQEPAMGARFYRVMAMLTAHRLEELISRLSYTSLSYSAGQSLDQTTQYENELDLDVMDNLSLAGARFDWMLRRLNVRGI